MTESTPAAKIDEMKAGLERTAVLKAQLAKIRAFSRNAPIFVIEGVDDVGVIPAWIRRVNSQVRVDTIPCSGKGKVLAFMESLEYDRSGISENVYYCMDHDFDGVREKQVDWNVTWITEGYSIENHIVGSEAVDAVLDSELACHGEPEIREAILKLFDKLYSDFVVATKEINFRIYVARKTKNHIDGKLPSKIQQLIEVSASSIGELIACPDDIFKLDEMPAEVVQRLRSEFDRLDGRLHYRGKFAVMFFRKWLLEMGRERMAVGSEIFSGATPAKRVTVSNVTLTFLATRSPVPPSFDSFIRRVLP